MMIINNLRDQPILEHQTDEEGLIMWPRKTSPIWKLFAAFMLVSFSWAFLSAQEMVGGKQVRTGLWEGREVKYAGGEIAVKLKAGVSQAEVLLLEATSGLLLPS